MNTSGENKAEFIEWVADARYFEKKPPLYLRTVFILTFLVSLLLYFLKENLMILLSWVVFFVVYARTTIPPVKIKYALNKFGLRYYGYYLRFSEMVVFGVVKKPKAKILKIFTRLNSNPEYSIILADDEKTNAQILSLMKEKVPYLEQVPKSEIEKLVDLLGRLTGLG